MGHYISSMIGIRTGGVISGETDTKDLVERIKKVAEQMEADDIETDWLSERCDHFLKGEPSAISPELHGHKGTYVVIAGVFNYWHYKETSELAKRLSVELGTDVMVMTWDEEIDTVQCNVFLDGRSEFEVEENPIGRILRRVT